MRGTLYFQQQHIYLTLTDQKGDYTLIGKRLPGTLRSAFQTTEEETKTKIKNLLCRPGIQRERFFNNIQDVEELNEEETWILLQQLIEWTKNTETIYCLSRLAGEIDRRYWEDAAFANSLSACFRFDISTNQISTLTFNRKRKEFKPRNVRIGYVFDQLDIDEKTKQEILQEWEMFLETTQEIRIEILESTQRNWRRLYHPELTPVKSCMTYRHLFTKVGAFYMALPTKPVLIMRNKTPIGRTILWEDKYYDRIYSCAGQSYTNIIAKLEKQTFRPVYSETLVYPFDPTVIRERKFIPYLDYMHWFGATSKDEALLSNNADTLIEILKKRFPERDLRIAAMCVPSHKERYTDAIRILRQFEVE